MDHLQFEAMLIDPSQSNPEERAALKAHLSTCSACRQLETALVPLNNHLRQASSVMPAEGFTLRFQNRLEVRQRRVREGMIAIALLAIAASLIALAFLFGGEVVTWIAPFVTSSLKSLGSVLRIGSMISLLGDFLSVLAQSIVGTFSPAYLFAGSLAFSGLLSLWLFSLYRFNYQSIRRE